MIVNICLYVTSGFVQINGFLVSDNGFNNDNHIDISLLMEDRL